MLLTNSVFVGTDTCWDFPYFMSLLLVELNSFYRICQAKTNCGIEMFAFGNTFVSHAHSVAVGLEMSVCSVHYFIPTFKLSDS